MKKLVAQSLLYFGILLSPAVSAQAPAKDSTKADPAQKETVVKETVTPPQKKPVVIDQKDFARWLKSFKAEAVKKGLSAKFVEAVLPDDMKALPRVIELDQNQPGVNRKKPEDIKDPKELAEYYRKRSLAYYLESRTSEYLVGNGAKIYNGDAALLNDVYKAYKVPPEVIVALYGVESNYNKIPEKYLFDIPQSLATLAHNPRRSDQFRKELFLALKMMQQEDMAPRSLRGSWAGCFGGVQFSAGSYFTYAVDFDGDGHKDIWNNKADIFASAAKHVKQVGWVEGEDICREVKLTKPLPKEMLNYDGERHSLKYWRDLGVTMPDGSEISAERASKTATLIQPDGKGTPGYLVFDNFLAIRKWNRSNFFVLSVWKLSQEVKARAEATAEKPGSVPAEKPKSAAGAAPVVTPKDSPKP